MVRLKATTMSVQKDAGAFQFLMVRLKVKPVIYDFYRRCYISIPYGAIKSHNFYFKINGSSSFQFLMVRLKVFALANKTTACSVFQFLMVRLKVSNL